MLRGIVHLVPGVALALGLHASFAVERSPAPAPARATFDAETIFDRVWSEARDGLQDTTRVRVWFTEARRARLREQVRGASGMAAVADVFNQFLDSLQISHTRLLTPDDLEFHLFGGLWSPWNLDTLQVWHIGIQWTRRGEDLLVRTVLEGYPAARAGIRRGDVLVSSAGTKLHPLRSFDAGSPLLTLRRGGRVMAVPVEPVYESPHRSFLQAMRNSVRWIDLGTRRVAYVHLWTVFGPLMTEEFPRLIDRLAAADGIILDLRDGYGGNWVPFLDAFFEDRRDYAVIESTVRYGEPRRLLPDSVAPHPVYRGAVVAVINEGTRSGKEAIAFQFLKSRRGRLVGTTTAGHFRGAGFFPSRAPDYMLELAQTHLLLDGVDLEGRGVTPDVEVPWPLDRSIPGDPQLDRAIEEMKALLGVP